MSTVNGLGNITAPVANSSQTANINKSVNEAAGFEKALEKAKANNDDAALKKVCEDFESIFVNMMFKSMRQASAAEEDDGLVEKSFGRGIFEEMRDEELSKKVAEGGGMGIANVMYRQLKKYSNPAETPEAATLDVKK